MPLPLLVAIFIAFGFDLRMEVGPISQADFRNRLFETAAGVAVVGLCAILVGQGVALWVARRGGGSPRIRRFYVLACRVIDILSLAIFAWTIHWVDWPGAVEWGLGLRETILVDELLILLPFLLAQFLAWWGLYAGERALRPERLRSSRAHYLILRTRQAMGLVLPVALVFSLGQDLLRRQWPNTAESPWLELGWMAAMGVLVLVLAPAFVRLAWPTRSLPAGDLRNRLEHLARRYRFRCTDILVWDTGGALVNAGVTGALPLFRYVLLTDALVENLDVHQVEAVFGHEVGHISHRHLFFFGFFFLGSIGVMALAREAMVWLAGATGLDWPFWSEQNTTSTMLALQAGVAVGFLAAYFLIVFGFLSRRFERQADVFGCRAVSCGRDECPPHADLNAMPGASKVPHELCPTGIRIFSSALSEVASLNGMDRESRWAWRHGSIARRIAFLEALEGRPEAERRFQRGVVHLRIALATILASSVVIAAVTGALAHLR